MNLSVQEFVQSGVPKGTPGVRSAQSRKTRFLYSCIARLVYLDTRVIGQSALPGEQSPPASSTRPGTTPTLHVLSAHKRLAQTITHFAQLSSLEPAVTFSSSLPPRSKRACVRADINRGRIPHRVVKILRGQKGCLQSEALRAARGLREDCASAARHSTVWQRKQTTGETDRKRWVRLDCVYGRLLHSRVAGCRYCCLLHSLPSHTPSLTYTLTHHIHAQTHTKAPTPSHKHRVHTQNAGRGHWSSLWRSSCSGGRG